jgi:hypothetical protein
MVSAWEEPRRQGEVEENKDGPDCAEEHERKGGWRASPPAIGVVDDFTADVSRVALDRSTGWKAY